jgi:hypothetical protein
MMIPNPILCEGFPSKHHNKMVFAIRCPRITIPLPIRHTILFITRIDQYLIRRIMITMSLLRELILMMEDSAIAIALCSLQ